MTLSLTEQTYQTVYTQFIELLTPYNSNPVPEWTRYSSLCALLKDAFPKISWVGFYLLAPDGNLWVGPYQGKVACQSIAPGKGVCGTSFQTQKVQIVPNVHDFPGHIACDSLSQSEIVLPIFKQRKCIGVLDLDSHALAAFDEQDAEHLKKLIDLIF